MYNVRIGDNVIIGAGSMVLQDLEDDGVYVGTPAVKIESFSKYVRKRICTETDITVKVSQAITHDEAQFCWDDFYNRRMGDKS